MELPFTERNNPLSANLDGSLSAAVFLKTLRACDAQIFTGFEGENCLFDEAVLRQIETLSSVCAKYLASGDGCIIFGGCGTSGRIAYLVAERFNQILQYELGQKPVFSYCCAGGDSALLLSDELPEDSPIEGILDYCSAIDGVQTRVGHQMKRSCYVAVTCGKRNFFYALCPVVSLCCI
jgi:N-acetylmuramic acid 6-phosphate (MurNAc-6-P) etherase